MPEMVYFKIRVKLDSWNKGLAWCPSLIMNYQKKFAQKPVCQFLSLHSKEIHSLTNSMARLPMRQASQMLRRMCTEVEHKRTLPDLVSAISSLPAHLQRDATYLQDALSDAGKATKAASDHDSDTFDREEARALARKAMLLYDNLTKRAEPLHEKINDAVNTTDAKDNPGESMASSNRPATTDSHERSQGSGLSPSSPRDQSKNAEQIRHIVPTADDAFAPHLRDSTNPIVRTFAPHIADLKYRLFIANHQRVWIGWSNWF